MNMDFTNWIEIFGGLASVYSFDIMPDGSFGEILLMAVNRNNAQIIAKNPNAPKFYPGIPWRKYFTDINFESFCYKCGSTGKPLYSYVNAHGYWLKGFYIPIFIQEEAADEQKKTAYVLYILDHSTQVDPDAMSQRSPEVSAAVINISIKLHETEDFLQAMSATVGEIKKVCGANICSMFTVDQSKQECRLIDDKRERTEYLQQLSARMGRTPYDFALSLEKALSGSDALLLDDLSVVKERDPVWYESLRSNDITSIVLYAVRFKMNLVGFIWAANIDVEKMMQIKETLELTSFLIGAVIANSQLLSALEVMSSTDALTQVSNRHRMDKRIDSLAADKSIQPAALGILYADLNGLKTVNDTLGHVAGDKLLSKAASLLKIAFADHEIYRAGGDEFVVLCPEITEKELDRQTVQLRALADTTPDVSFAIGTVFLSGDYDINKAMMTADERMYKDKEEYYRQHPEKDRCRRSQ